MRCSGPQATSKIGSRSKPEWSPSLEAFLGFAHPRTTLPVLYAYTKVEGNSRATEAKRGRPSEYRRVLEM